MEKSSLVTVGLGSLTLSATSAFVTRLYTTYKGTPQAGTVVGAAAVNSGITGLTFFSVREFAVSPVLTRVAPWAQYVERKRELGIDAPSGDATSTSIPVIRDLRTDKLLDSGLSGGITGGLLRGLISGRPAILPGTLTGAAICTVLQYGYNELNLARLRYINKLNEQGRSAVDVPVPGFKPRTGTVARPPVASASYTEAFLKMVGLVPVSDEEYLEKLKRTREVYLNRIAQLEPIVEEEKLAREIQKSS